MIAALVGTSPTDATADSPSTGAPAPTPRGEAASKSATDSGEAPPRKTKPSVFLFVIDTARADVFERCRDDGVEGWFTALSRDGLRFEQARTSSPWTRPAVASLFTGLAPWQHRVLGRRDVLGSDVETLAESFSAAGYATRAFATNPNVLPVWGFEQGFDSFEDVGADAWRDVKPSAPMVLQRLRSAIESAGDRPMFYYVHLMDPHEPLGPVEAPETIIQSCGKPPVDESAGAYARWFRKSLWPRYIGELRTMGRALEATFAAMKEAGVYDDSIILVIADHGEEFADHGRLGHGKQMYEETLRIPAVLKLPRGRLGDTRVREPVGLEDFHRILLEEAGVGSRAPEGDGLGLRPDAAQVAILRIDGFDLTSITNDGWKLVLDHENGTEELFELASDPHERKNRIAEKTDIAKALRDELMGIVEHNKPGLHLRFCGTPEVVELDFEIRGANATVHTIGFEDHDELAQKTEVTRIGHVRLASPRVDSDTRGAFPKGVPLPSRVDSEEIVLELDPGAPEPGQLRVAFPKPEGWDLAFGAENEVEPLRDLDLADLTDEAVVGPGVEIHCDAARPRPLLRVWRTPAAETARDESVDPELQRRLRALGYAE